MFSTFRLTGIPPAKTLSFNRRGGVCPPEDINRSICGRIQAGKPCPYRYLAKADIHFSILNERTALHKYLIYTKDLKRENSIDYIPVYMTLFL